MKDCPVSQAFISPASFISKTNHAAREMREEPPADGMEALLHVDGEKRGSGDQWNKIPSSSYYIAPEL